MGLDFARAHAAALDRVRDARIETDPFPHIIVHGFLCDDLYQGLLGAVPSSDGFESVHYPGTGFDNLAAKASAHGLAVTELGQEGPLGFVNKLFASAEFQRLLLDRFSAEDAWPGHGPAIPVAKHNLFTQGRRDVTTVFALHRDLPGYSISPHRDADEKVVTFLYYIEPDDALAAWGTLLCRPKAGLSFDDIERSTGYRGHEKWRDWALFDVTKVAPARPNTLLLFAPNHASYHAVRMNIPEDHPRRERTVLRGFIRAGADSSNWMKPAGVSESSKAPGSPTSAFAKVRRFIGRGMHKTSAELRHRGLVRGNFEAVVVSCGGTASTALLEFLGQHLVVNHRNSLEDGIKHIITPNHPVLRDTGVERAVYVFADPRDAALSLFRRGYAGKMATKLQSMHSTAYQYRQATREVADFSLATFLEEGVDRFGFHAHWANWRHGTARFPVMLVKYPDLFDVLPEVFRFLGLSPTLPHSLTYAPRASRRDTLDSADQARLDEIYGELARELMSEPPFQIRYPQS